MDCKLFEVTGVVAVDLRSNIAAEARAKIVYERLIPYFNGSTGDSQYGEIGLRGPRNESHGLTLVESEAKGDKGLDVPPYDPEPGTRKNSPVDSTPVGAYTGGPASRCRIGIMPEKPGRPGMLNLPPEGCR